LDLPAQALPVKRVEKKEKKGRKRGREEEGSDVY